MSSIRISQLNSFTNIKDEDFLPLVDSSSLTTYRVTVTAFNDWLADSGSALSASYAANADNSVSASWADMALSSSTTMNLMYPNTSTASYSVNSLSSSWSDRSGVSISSISTTGTASFATSAKSSSYAGTSSVALTASYVNFALGVPPTSSYAYSASFSDNARSSSYAQTASWAGRSSMADTASYVDTGGSGVITKNFGNIGASWMVANAGYGFAVDNDLFVYNYCRHSGRRILSKINMQTNVVTFLQQWPQDRWNVYARAFIRPEDGKTRAIINTDSSEYDYNITDNVLTSFAGSNGHWLSLPVLVTNWSNVSRPDVIALFGSYDAGSPGDSPVLAWQRIYHNGSSWTYSFTSSIDLRSCINNTEFRKFYNYSTDPSITANTLLWDFNYIKNRYYLMDTNTGYMHIFSHTTGNITSSWNATSITYEKTLAVPSPHQEIWTNTKAERMVVDYDLTTGDEKGIVMNRRGNDALNGSVVYINWPEYGNW